jgi:hypothetical protein
MGEEPEEESFEEIDDDFEAEVGDDIEDDDIDLGDIDEDDVGDFDAEDAEEAPRRRTGGGSSNKDDADLLTSNYELAVKANPKRAQKHQKRARLIEGVLDTAELTTDAGAAKAWNALQNQASDAKKRAYSVKEEFTENDVIEHPKFGEGYVVEILTSTKMAVLFEVGVKKLAHNHS